jgi:DNA replication protein
MERNYPPDWIQEAFEIAVSNNKRALRYIQAVLKRWETDGKDEGYGGSGRSSAQDQPKNYIPDEFSDIIRS